MNEVIPLRTGHGSTGQQTVVEEIQGRRDVRLIRNVVEPSLTVHRPSRPNGTAVIVCPGGSFVTLAEATGTDVASRLIDHGVTAYVLRYRLLASPPDDDDFVRGWSGFELADIRAQALVAMEDLTRAVQVVRESTSDRVGTLGFSAGGLLTIATAAGTAPPDFAAAVYGPVWHPVTVPNAPPPLFLALAGDDQGDGVVAGNLAVCRDWLAAGGSAEMHLYAEGGHGFVAEELGLPCDSWFDRYLDWMRHHARPLSDDRPQW
jgi:dienelactone hydrolase